jgi:hypothetical protein
MLICAAVYCLPYLLHILNQPHNSREIARKATVIIGMQGQQTTIRDPENPKEEPKKFAFDYSYWSHDGYKEDANGYLQSTGSKYADQVSWHIIYFQFSPFI